MADELRIVYVVMSGDEIDEIFETRVDAEKWARANVSAIWSGQSDEDAAMEAIEERELIPADGRPAWLKN